MLVLGGTSGAGKVIAKEFDADSIGTKHGMTSDDILSKSLDYDITINCISTDFQYEVMEKLVYNNPQTYHITMGGLRGRYRDENNLKRRVYNLSEKIVFDNVPTRHTLINPAWLFTSKEEAGLKLISQSDLISIIKFLIGTADLESVISQIDIKGGRKC